MKFGNGLASEISVYRQAVRPHRVAKYRKRHPYGPAPSALLLNKKNGNPVTYIVLRRAFKTAAATLGLPSLRLHWARHAFACNFLAANAIMMIRKAAAAGMQLNEATLDTILKQLRPELAELMGHADFATTERYLTRVREAVLAHLAAYPQPPDEARAA